MEDGFPLFNPNNEAVRQEERLKEYYEEFSSNARRRLLAKTIVRPNTVYDILYPATREALLSKNTPVQTNLEEEAKIIRDKLLAKMILEQTDLEKISEDFRKSLLARQKIQDDRVNLIRDSQTMRDNLLAKNALGRKTNLEKDSEQQRNANLAKNKPNPSQQNSIDKNSTSFRDNALAKNSAKEFDLLRDSEAFRNQYRQNDIHKNVPINVDLEKDSTAFRNNNLAKNKPAFRKTSLDDIADEKRLDSLAKNTPTKTDLDRQSAEYRRDDLAKNSSKESDLLRDSEDIRNQYRVNDINRNVPNKTDLEKDSSIFRRDNLSKNKNLGGRNLADDAEIYRNANLSIGKTAPNAQSIDDFADGKRLENSSKNKPNNQSLERDSVPFRQDDLSLNVKSISDLEKDSVLYRKNDLSLNKPKTSNLEVDSAPFREDDMSLNKPKTTDLESISIQFRKDDLSLNTPSESNLERDSIDYRADDMSLNKPSFSNLEVDSTPFREDDMSLNKPKFTNLEKDSERYRADDLSLNKPSFSNLETDSVPFREDDLSLNKPKLSDLERDSEDYRLDDLSLNVPSTSDIEKDSVQFRADDLSFNVPSTSDLIVDSTPFLYNNVSANVPSDSDLSIDSIPFRDNNLAPNVPNPSNLFTDSEDFRDNNLSANVPSSGDLLTDSAPYRNMDLAANVPINSSLLSDSVQYRDDDLARNIPIQSDLLADSKTFRDSAIASNAGYGLLGVNVQGAGTSAFLGISRVFTQGVLVRTLLLSKNKPSTSDLFNDSEVFRQNNVAPNKWQYSNNEYTSTNQNWTLGKITQGSINTNLVDYSPLDPYYTPTAKAIFATDDYIVNKGKDLQKLFGVSRDSDFPTKRRDRTISDALYHVSTAKEKGGEFLDYFFRRDTYVPFWEGSITKTIRNYNQERNAFNLNGLQPGSPDSLNTLKDVAVDGFQDLIAKTIGSFKALTQIGTLTTPANIVNKNLGAYYAGGASNIDILRPTGGDDVNSAEAMMAKTVLGNPFEDEDFLAGRRGVKRIVNTIKNSNASQLAANFDPQNNTAYITGKNRDGSPRVARQRFTIANPYAPGRAQKLIFSIKNYSSGAQFYFPPYIQSIQNSENANWNSTNFLGRPEAVYTYNNSSRDASISFFILTDYAQSVDIGVDWASETMDTVTANFGTHFTEKDYQQNEQRKQDYQNLLKQQKDLANKKDEINNKLDENSAERTVIQEQAQNIEGDSQNAWTSAINSFKDKKNKLIKDNQRAAKKNSLESAELKEQQQNISSQQGDVQTKIGEVDEANNIPTDYFESKGNTRNVYGANLTKNEYENGEIVSKPEDTIKRINEMKSGLMFQPSYFSGDKIDFVRKVEFLSKLTRPAAPYEGEQDGPKTGFSFIKPPVCHIKLGDWWDHDIIVNSVSFDYADAPWTLDGGRVQPMWAIVSINFNIIGSYGDTSGRPPLSTDTGGMYSPRS